MPSNRDADLDPEAIEKVEFSNSFRGYDQAEVRKFLRLLAGRLKDREVQSAESSAESDKLLVQIERLEGSLSDANARLEALSEVAPDSAQSVSLHDLDDAEITNLLGEETVRVLTSAKQAANEITQRAENTAQETVAMAKVRLTEAESSKAAIVEEANQKASEIIEAANAEAESIREQANSSLEEAKRGADTEREKASNDAESIRAEAEADSLAAADAAREHARQMLVEAQSVREKVLSDLVVKRRLARQQLDGVKAARDRLSRSLFDVRSEIDKATTELSLAVPEARLALEGFTRRNSSSQDQADVTALASKLDDQLPPPELGASRPAGVASTPTVSTGSGPVGSGQGTESPNDEVTVEPSTEETVDEEVVLDEGDADATATGGDKASGSDAEEETALDEAADEADLDPSDDEDHSIDGLFARMRKNKPANPPETDAEVDPINEADLLDTTAEEESTESDEVAEVDGEPQVRSEFMDRDVVLTRFGPDVRRLVKRAFADDLSELLEMVRTGKGDPSVDELAPTENLKEAVADALTGGLTKASVEGSKAIGSDSGCDVSDLVDQLVNDLVDPFRQRVEHIMGRSTADREELLDPFRALYRDVRSNELSEIAADGLAGAFALGLYSAIGEGLEVSWVTDVRSNTGADCHDNTLAGEVAKGTEFPTGHRHPLVEPGCRCLVLPA